MNIGNQYRKKDHDGWGTSVDYNVSAEKFSYLSAFQRGGRHLPPRYKNITKVLRNNPFKFIRNDGQLDNEVMYYTRRGMASFFFTKKRIVFSFLRNNGPKQGIEPDMVDRLSRISDLQEGIYERLVCTMEFKGARPDVVIEGLDECQETVNYFKGRDSKKWCTRVPCFERIIYRNLYPAIDLVCRFNDGNVKYDFIIKPGASLRDINLAYSGIDGLEIDDGGNLVIKTPMGDFFDGRPEGYQEIDGQKVDVGAEFELRRRTGSEFTYGFRINKRYNPNYPVVIDPEIIYSSYLGGSGVDDGFAIAVDQNSCVYVTGQTTSLDFPTRNGFDTALSGTVDAFVTKISRIPSIVYSTYLGGSGEDFGQGIGVDRNGNVYITGITGSDDFPTVNAFQNNRNGLSDAFITKINPSGAIVYSSYLGGSGSDSGLGIAVDESGNAYITGATRSTNFPTVNAFDNTLGGEVDAFVTKISSAPAIVYSSYLGGSNFDVGLGVAVDQNGNAYITGDTLSDDFPTVSPFDNTRNGFDAFITKISPAPAIVYSSFLGGSGSDIGNSVAVDQNGNAYITGTTSSMDFPRVNAFQNNFGGGTFDAFITKVSPTPAIVYSSYLGGNGNDDGNGVTVDQNGNAYIAGFTNSTNFSTVNAFDNTLSGPDDAFIAKISPAPAIVYSSYLGGDGDEEAFGVAVDRIGNAYVTGLTTSINFPAVNAFQRMYGGGEEDGFVAKIEAVSQRPECILTRKVFDSQKKRECSYVFIPAYDKDCSRYTLTGIKFEKGIIDEKTLTITPVATNPDYKYVRFMFIVPCISKFKDYRTGKVVEKAGYLTDIWAQAVLYMPKGRDEFKFNIIIETLTKLPDKPKKVRGGFKVGIGVFYVVKSTARVQLEVISNGYCVPLDDCNVPRKDECRQFYDPETPFPEFYPGQQ